MTHHRGFTLVDLVVLFVVLTLLFAIFAPMGCGAREVANRTVCSTNLSGIYKAAYTYSITDRGEHFPIAGSGAAGSRVVGFREGDRATGKGAMLEGNATASLWMLVRNGATSETQFVCNSSDDQADIFTQPLKNTQDFSERRNLSYSMMNMYHKATGAQWSADVKPDWVLLADNNASDHADRHRVDYADRNHQDRMAEVENSPNHGGEGQNILFGDGHASFEQHPFVGKHNDNVFAMTFAGRDAPPELGNDAGDAATDRNVTAVDSVLLPVSGNGGGAGSLSGLPMDVIYRDRTKEQFDRAASAYIGTFILAGCIVWIYNRWPKAGRLKSRRLREPASSA
ncbi:MAG: hypothetical protein GC162_02325 [Planctomycetes bacterium]|nr:hypothetical protein [Planctomycetota bacterium]